MNPYIEELARIAGDTFVSCYPNAGLPNPMSDTGFDETPEITGSLVEEFAKSVPVGDADIDRVVLLALRIEGVPRPMPGPGRLDLEDEAIAHLFSGGAVPDPRVARANLSAAGRDMDPGFAIAARPVAEIRRLRGKRDGASADRHERRQCDSFS